MYINNTVAVNATLPTTSNFTNIPNDAEFSIQHWQGFWELLPQQWTREAEAILWMWMYATSKDIARAKARLAYKGYKRIQKYRESDIGDDFLNYNDPSKLRERAHEMEEILMDIENGITVNIEDYLTDEQLQKFLKLDVTYSDQMTFNQHQSTNSNNDLNKNDKSWSLRKKKTSIVIPEPRAIERIVKYRDILQFSGKISVEDGKYKTRFKLEPLYQSSKQTELEDLGTILDALREKVPIIDVENESQSIYDHFAAGTSLL
ncbi:hypothetical protein BN7_4910 [Wickerhamomyces ciferrii]|uniref:Uncharacterized protein n=1 Tax=Wickerhamomyces ciferrii (strain ATCC 14091 / BCRC 22168 / CBS 111 / JCM 3599 / NBRC 0793 / NRRL Y-1031 F-60-10) TaxID=1206466 RepID=K0KW27_WICCF|nr:uncharacterized protein BN7_4910 [Wickerhamomyces ciferrii]CCH45328.1 hypothetical protein BN7_4910 [Wickerhamomyces ciferrii]